MGASTTISPRRALQIVFAIGLFGSLFSGYLSFGELLASSKGLQPCPPLGEPGTVLGYPACFYGLFLYAAIVVVSGFGLRGTPHFEGAGPEAPPAAR